MKLNDGSEYSGEFKMVRHMARALSSGQMAKFTMEGSKTIICTARAFTSGQMAKFMMESGLLVSRMG